jgi:ATP-dependent DNA helicase RecG
MNMLENHETDKKSLRIIVGASADWSELSKDCVAFANAAGGRLLLGIENKATLPPSNQKIPDALVEQLRKRIPQLTVNVSIHPERKIAANGGEYIELTVFRCPQSVASTSDGKFYIRVSDDSKPVLPDDLNRLVGEKNAFVWELQTPQKVPAARCDEQKIDDFLKRIHASERVSGFVKHKSVPELLNHYFFVKDGYLTNLGVLWIGKREDRALLQHAPVIQFIKYDAGERKVNKIVWDD